MTEVAIAINLKMKILITLLKIYEKLEIQFFL